jgi:hypothetical protein
MMPGSGCEVEIQRAAQSRHPTPHSAGCKQRALTLCDDPCGGGDVADAGRPTPLLCHTPPARCCGVWLEYLRTRCCATGAGGGERLRRDSRCWGDGGYECGGSLQRVLRRLLLRQDAKQVQPLPFKPAPLTLTRLHKQTKTKPQK